jgi:hypothetical protein
VNEEFRTGPRSNAEDPHRFRKEPINNAGSPDNSHETQKGGEASKSLPALFPP